MKLSLIRFFLDLLSCLFSFAGIMKRRDRFVKRFFREKPFSILDAAAGRFPKISLTKCPQDRFINLGVITTNWQKIRETREVFRQHIARDVYEWWKKP